MGATNENLSNTLLSVRLFRAYPYTRARRMSW